MATGNRQQRKRRRLALVATLGAILAVLGMLIWRESRLKRPQEIAVTAAGFVDMCLSCHTEEKLDPAHDVKVIGCAVCHLGNPLAITATEAHQGMVRNPGDLRHVEKTCAVEGCHPLDAHKVKNSLMATNRGIIGTLLHYWGESPGQDTDLTVEQLLASGQTSLALDYYRKLCATCHLWKQKNDLPGVPDFFNAKGGGCSACHFQQPDGEDRSPLLAADGSEPRPADEKKKKPHPLVTAKVPSDNCIRCHNRSGRIGLSYRGMFESEGYGTPFEKGSVSSKQLPGARFYLELADDVHHQKGMECIDCHTRNEIMGDGTSYAHYEQQVEISCQSCHTTSRPGATRKGAQLTNVAEGSRELSGKIDQKKRPLRAPKEGVCTFPAHRRLSCESCHSTWVPQCNGCHVKRDLSKTHLDKLTLQETPGQWEEGRSYIRYEKPMLAVWDEQVVIVTPGCQDIVTLVDGQGEMAGAFNRFTMAAINPHTTQAKGRSCQDCHALPKTVGLGEGTLMERHGRIEFVGLDQGVDTVPGRTPAFDAFVDIDGKALQHGSRPGLRPFNSEELQKILRVGRCAGCHDSYQDPLWRSYSAATVCPQQTAGSAAGQPSTAAKETP